MVADYPLWAEIAFREMLSGVEEIHGPAHSLRILDYHQTTSLRASSDEIPWCSAGLNWVMRIAGIRGTDSAAARSWLAWGQELGSPRLGCIVVFWRGEQRGPFGHVGLYVGHAAERILVLGGNQGDRWSVQGYSDDRLLGYRWPRESDRFL